MNVECGGVARSCAVSDNASVSVTGGADLHGIIGDCVRRFLHRRRAGQMSLQRISEFISGRRLLLYIPVRPSEVEISLSYTEQDDLMSSLLLSLAAQV